MPFKSFRLSEDITLVQETGLAKFMRCNIWHVRGREFDLVIDTGMGLDPLKQYILQQTERPIKAIVTHCHFDHSGGLYEFDCRLGHPAEAAILADPENEKVVYGGGWTRIGIVDPKAHPDFSPDTFRVKAAPLTGYLDEGDEIDLGNRHFRILYLPGHSPGSIGLWEEKTGTLFSGDALYDGELLDNLYHSEPETYRRTLERISKLGVEVFHAGHFPSFGKEKAKTLIASYLAGTNTILDVDIWYAENRDKMRNIFSDQNWSRAEPPR